VKIPEFSFEFDADLRQGLEQMGLRRVFESSISLTDMANGTEGAMLRGISQKTKI
jgi:serine protease inhibitor